MQCLLEAEELNSQKDIEHEHEPVGLAVVMYHHRHHVDRDHCQDEELELPALHEIKHVRLQFVLEEKTTCTVKKLMHFAHFGVSLSERKWLRYFSY